MFVLQYSSQPLRPSWDQQVKNESFCLKSMFFLSNRRISRNYQQYRTNYMKICLLMLPGDHGDTVSADKCLVPYTVHTNQEHASLVLATCFSPEMSFLPAVYWMAKSTSDHNASDVQEKSGMLEQLSLTRPCLVLPFMSTDSSFQGLELMLPQRSFS